MAAETQASEVKKGLEGVIAGETAICQVDGDRCELIYRGYNIDELVGRASYEEVTYLLLNGPLPTKGQLNEWVALLNQQVALSAPVEAALRSLPAQEDPMSLLRTAVSAMGLYDHEADDDSMDSVRRKAISTIAKLPTMVAAIGRLAEGKALVAPKPELGIAGNFLYMLHGKPPTREQTQALDVYFVLLAEHGFNASTFAARVVTGTRSDYYSAIVAAIGTLKGPLHGAAGRKAMETLEEIGTVENVEPFVQQTLANHQRFMGFGHRVYKGEDPRGKHLKRYAEQMAKAGGEMPLFQVSERLQESVFRAKKLNINVDFYSAPLLHYLGIPTSFFTAMFAASRIAGWSAHVIEQTADNRLIRPLARYVGRSNLKFVPLAERSSPQTA